MTELRFPHNRTVESKQAKPTGPLSLPRFFTIEGPRIVAIRFSNHLDTFALRIDPLLATISGFFFRSGEDRVSSLMPRNPGIVGREFSIPILTTATGARGSCSAGALRLIDVPKSFKSDCYFFVAGLPVRLWRKFRRQHAAGRFSSSPAGSNHLPLQQGRGMS